ncbi:amidase [Bacillus infantis]|uniref:amidase n=1 Tax=Bacillus infantis TaxID=324767 RepID=UPI003CE9460A
MNKLFLENDALALAELVKKKEAAPIELAEAAIGNIETLNPGLNAVINKMYEQAKADALTPDLEGSFAGVPMLLKDITQEMAGERITSGSKALQNYRAKSDSEFVARLRRTGAIFIGQTNVPELALMGVTEPEFYGPARNPWNPDYTPGGSSGGSAAAVASGMVPIAGANDGGGSIRIPAAYCGLFGLKPGRGRTPALGLAGTGRGLRLIMCSPVRSGTALPC